MVQDTMWLSGMLQLKLQVPGRQDIFTAIMRRDLGNSVKHAVLAHAPLVLSKVEVDDVAWSSPENRPSDGKFSVGIAGAHFVLHVTLSHRDSADLLSSRVEGIFGSRSFSNVFVGQFNDETNAKKRGCTALGVVGVQAWTCYRAEGSWKNVQACSRTAHETVGGLATDLRQPSSGIFLTPVPTPTLAPSSSPQSAAVTPVTKVGGGTAQVLTTCAAIFGVLVLAGCLVWYVKNVCRHAFKTASDEGLSTPTTLPPELPNGSPKLPSPSMTDKPPPIQEVLARFTGDVSARKSILQHAARNRPTRALGKVYGVLQLRPQQKDMGRKHRRGGRLQV